jgi:hypothetical protein
MPTAIPETAGVTDWLRYENTIVGVRKIAWDSYLGYFRPEKDKIFLSIYIVAINLSEGEETFNPFDFALIDGGGEVNGQLLVSKEPEFSLCTVRTNGVCEGWWSTAIWNRPEVQQNLIFRWSPSFWDPSMETPISQSP